MNEISIIRNTPVLGASKEELSTMVNSYLKELAYNGGDVLKDLALCRKYSFLLEELEKGIKSYVLKELSSFERNEASVLGAEIKTVESGVKYDYSESSEWVKQKKVVDEATAKLKDIETFIKSLKSKTTVVDDNTGEVIEFFPASKSSSTTIRVTLQ